MIALVFFWNTSIISVFEKALQVLWFLSTKLDIIINIIELLTLCLMAGDVKKGGWGGQVEEWGWEVKHLSNKEAKMGMIPLCNL